MVPNTITSVTEHQQLRNEINQTKKYTYGFLALGIVGLVFIPITPGLAVWGGLSLGAMLVGFLGAGMSAYLHDDAQQRLVELPVMKGVNAVTQEQSVHKLGMTAAPALYVEDGEVLTVNQQIAVQQPVHSNASIMKALPATPSVKIAVVNDKIMSTPAEDKAAKIVAQAKKSAVEYCKAIATQNAEEDVSANSSAVVVNIATEASKQSVNQVPAVSAATSTFSSFKNTLFSFAKRIKRKQNSPAGVDLGVPLLEVSQRM